MPHDLLNTIALANGWRFYLRVWTAVSRHFTPELLLSSGRFTVVPDHFSSINAAINSARLVDGERVVIVRPGRYTESVRLTRDVTIAGLGPRHKIILETRGSEAALVWGGFAVNYTQARGMVFRRATAGTRCSAVHNLTISTRSRLQQYSVYIVSGAPIITHCDIEGTILVAGLGTVPCVRKCNVRGVRSHAYICTDHAAGACELSHLSVSKSPAGCDDSDNESSDSSSVGNCVNEHLYRLSRRRRVPVKLDLGACPSLLQNTYTWISQRVKINATHGDACVDEPGEAAIERHVKHISHDLEVIEKVMDASIAVECRRSAWPSSHDLESNRMLGQQ
eukprot:scaffold187815_cov28-Tisochrysis_lutea.AAC.2